MNPNTIVNIGNGVLQVAGGRANKATFTSPQKKIVTRIADGRNFMQHYKELIPIFTTEEIKELVVMSKEMAERDSFFAIKHAALIQLLDEFDKGEFK